MSKKRKRTGKKRTGVRARLPAGGHLIFKRDGILIKGKVRHDHLELPAVQELIRELHAKLHVASEPSEFARALWRFKKNYRRVTTSVSPTNSGQTIDVVDVSLPSKLDPPRIAEFMLTTLATSRAAEAMIGDLNERFTSDCNKLGRRRAVQLYWARTLRSLWPLLRRAISRAVKWSAVIDTVRRHL
jgi:hypothetical protein